ncbi:TonB-dependent receptor [Candidatus Thioglobus sp.]|nr:TonB-dependent receptor [Candidatus Thioglobus sp.]
MFFKNLIFAASMSAILISNSANAVIGPIKITLNPTEVSSNYFNEDDISAPFASEIYTEDDIKNSQSNNIYDFLTQNTSLSLAPSSGNKFSQKISARGYGLTIGSHNLVVTLNGRRLNSISTDGPAINTININDVEKIEITKGSGSVIYGDSAMAGAIHIYTKKNFDTKVSTTFGNYGLVQTSASFGISQEKIDLNMSIDNLKHGGYSVADPKGNKDKGEETKSNINARYVTDGGTEFELNYDLNDSENRYPNWLTQAQFNANPAQNSTGRVYTISDRESDTLTYKVNRQLSDNFTLYRSSSILNKETIVKSYNSSAITTYGNPSKYQYDYYNTDYILSYENGNVKIDSGYTSLDGSRTFPVASAYVPANTTSKKNIGFFSQLQYDQNDSTYSIGARNETVEYEYKPVSGTQKNAKHHLEAFDVGFNTRLNPSTTVFTNFNQAFQAPLIDRFFTYNGGFNGFMSPSTSKTINVGLNFLTEKSKTKVTLYRSNVSNEMFYNSATYNNTNLDESHKQGLELQNLFALSPKWSTNVNYAYTNAIIDKEADNSSFNGKINPMTSKQNISASVIYSFSDKTKMTLTQKYRSSAFAEEDYTNTATQKQKAYNSTDFNFSFSPNEDLEFNFDVENLFENSYGTWLRADVIYPGNFTRNINASLSYKF